MYITQIQEAARILGNRYNDNLNGKGEPYKETSTPFGDLTQPPEGESANTVRREYISRKLNGKKVFMEILSDWAKNESGLWDYDVERLIELGVTPEPEN